MYGAVRRPAQAPAAKGLKFLEVGQRYGSEAASHEATLVVRAGATTAFRLWLHASAPAIEAVALPAAANAAFGVLTVELGGVLTLASYLVMVALSRKPLQ